MPDKPMPPVPRLRPGQAKPRLRPKDQPPPPLPRLRRIAEAMRDFIGQQSPERPELQGALDQKAMMEAIRLKIWEMMAGLRIKPDQPPPEPPPPPLKSPPQPRWAPGQPFPWSI